MNRLSLRHHRKRKTRHCSAAQRLVLDELRLHSWFDCPVVSLAWIVLGSFLFDEGLVQAEIMADAILPTWVAVLVI
jgi:hypothetical protein